MSNHLFHRWPHSAPRPISYSCPVAKKDRRPLWIALYILVGIVVAGALVLGSYLAISRLAGTLSQPNSGKDAPMTEVDWAPSQLPWASPDPTVSLAVQPQGATPLSSQDIYSHVLPSVVCVTADQGDGYVSVGSGVVVTTSGHIVTNYHIIKGGIKLDVSLLSTQEHHLAQLVGFDEELDLAVLKINAPGLVPAQLGSSDLLTVGDGVYAIGNPLGYLHGSMTEGIISSPTRTIPFNGRNMTLLQTSTALNSGNSGGALANQYGQVVGITAAKITGIENDTVIEGLGLVIPMDDALPFITQIIHTGKSTRPSLGIVCQEATLEEHSGIYVNQVTPQSPAATLLKTGDLILAANGTDTTTLYTLTRILNETGVGHPVELSVLRNGQRHTISVTLYDRMDQN